MKIKFNAKAYKLNPDSVEDKSTKSVTLAPNLFKKLLGVAKNRKFLAVIGVLVLVVISFIAGVKVGPYLNVKESLARNPRENIAVNRNNPNITNRANRPEPSGTVASANSSKNLIFSGKITSISSLQLEMVDQDGVSNKFDITSKTIVSSLDGKAVKSDELKVGYTVAIYASKGENDTLTISRLKITAID
jgi:hypothetical protein